MGFFDFFKTNSSNEQISVDFSNLGVDLHSHLIPGIDDGSKSLEDSIQLIKELKNLGFHKIITTPHIMSDYYRNNPDIILSGRDKVREELQRLNIDVAFDAAAEYYYDEYFVDILKANKVIAINSEYLLFELSYLTKPTGVKEIIFEIQLKGYKPLLAHPERYPYYGNAEDYEQIRASGCLLQLNTISLTGYYGKSSKQAAETLIDHNCVDFLGSDMHHLRHADALKDCLFNDRLKKVLSQPQLLNNTL